MGWLSRDVTCQACGQQRPRRTMLALLPKGGQGICADCGRQWSQNGRLCAVCGARVHGPQKVAYFADRGGFGHYDCTIDAPGGLPVAVV